MKITIYEGCKAILSASSLPELRKKLGREEMARAERKKIESIFIQTALNALVQKYSITDITYVAEKATKEKLFIELDLVSSRTEHWQHNLLGNIRAEGVWYGVQKQHEGKRLSACAE